MLGRFTEAAAAYRKAIEINPDHAIAHNNLGNALTVLGRFTEAAAAYRKAIEINPDDVFAHNGLGVVLRELGRRFTEAEAAHRKAIEIDPGHPTARGWLGELLLLTGKPDQAQVELEQAGSQPRVELLRWIAARAKGGASVHTPDSVLAAFAEPPPAKVVPPSPFRMAEVRALALAGRGDGDQAVRVLRSAVDDRQPRDRFARPLYDLLAVPEPVAGLEGLLEVWREIIAADPSAAGPWGGPDPA
ncbi:hypothetical protein GCM10009727_89080 [Actinomadura napierensis]|uniref:Tetratricopeptide repeat protein n=1 Tax=Actinomadura napierensis TaxID=267854 RepID=A0ABN3AGS5_9ACTN